MLVATSMKSAGVKFFLFFFTLCEKNKAAERSLGTRLGIQRE